MNKYAFSLIPPEIAATCTRQHSRPTSFFFWGGERPGASDLMSKVILSNTVPLSVHGNTIFGNFINTKFYFDINIFDLSERFWWQPLMLLSPQRWIKTVCTIKKNSGLINLKYNICANNC